MDLQQGSCIRLRPVAIDSLQLEAVEPSFRSAGPADQQPPGPEQLYQVIGIDQPGNRCWLRCWPLARRGSPVFELALHQVQGQAPHRPLSQGRHEG